MSLHRETDSTTWMHDQIAQLNAIRTLAQTVDTTLQQTLRDFATQLIHASTHPPTDLATSISNTLLELPKIFQPNSQYARLLTQQQQNNRVQATAQHARDEVDARALLNRLPTLQVSTLHQLIADLLQHTPIATLRQRFVKPPKYRMVSKR